MAVGDGVWATGVRRLASAARRQPIGFAVAAGVVWALVSFALAGLWRGWTADSLLTSALSALLAGPFFAACFWVRGQQDAAEPTRS